MVRKRGAVELNHPSVSFASVHMVRLPLAWFARVLVTRRQNLSKSDETESQEMVGISAI